jgi:oligoribonuclease NrnB/cAMP/cGMP phosphodiesterase (DHH superfamily)
LRYEKTLVEKMATEVIMVSLAGHKVPAVHSAILTSQIGEYLSSKYPFCLIWHQKDGRRYFSLRSRTGGISVAEIAAQYGGGGHTHAAGFSISLDGNSQNFLNPVLGLSDFSPASAQS